MPPAIMPTDFTVLTTGLDFLSGRMANLPAGWTGREAWHSHWAMGGGGHPDQKSSPPGEGLKCGSYHATLVIQDSMEHGEPRSTPKGPPDADCKEMGTGKG